MADPQSLLQPGETLGTPVPAPPTTQSNNSLLQPGETLGTPVPAQSNTDPNLDNPSDILKGMGEEAWSTIKGAATEVFPGAHQLYQRVSDLPQNYRDYEAARQNGKSPIEAANEVAAKEDQKTSMVNALKQRVKEFSNHPNEATGKLIVDLVPLLLTHGAPEAETAAATTAGTEAATTADATSLLEPGETMGEPVPQPEAPAPGGGIFRSKPGYQTVDGNNIPVRAQNSVAKVLEPFADKGKLRDFEVNQTQPAVRQAVGSVAADAADTTAPVETPGKADAFGFGSAADEVAGRAKVGFKKLDELSNGEFSKAQNEADIARSSLDFEGKKAYQTALDKQNKLFNKYADQFPEEDLQQLKADWKQKSGLDELATRFNRSVGPTPAELTKPGQPDLGYVNPNTFRNNIIDAVQNGEFDKAGFTPEHVQSIEDLGRILEKAKVANPEGINAILGSTLKHFIVSKAVGGAIGGVFGGPVGALVGIAGEHAAELLAGKALGSIMTDLPSVRVLTAGLATGASPDLVAQKINEQPGFLQRMKQAYADSRASGEEGAVGNGVTKQNVGQGKMLSRINRGVNPSDYNFTPEELEQARARLDAANDGHKVPVPNERETAAEMFVSTHANAAETPAYARPLPAQRPTYVQGGDASDGNVRGSTDSVVPPKDTTEAQPTDNTALSDDSEPMEALPKSTVDFLRSIGPDRLESVLGKSGPLGEAGLSPAQVSIMKERLFGAELRKRKH